MQTATKHFTLRTPAGALTTVRVSFSSDEPTSRQIAGEIIDRLGKLSAQVIKEKGCLIEHSFNSFSGYAKEGQAQ